MITVQEADKLIAQNIKEMLPVKVPLNEAYGMVLREDLVADRDIPPYNRVTMDGIGIPFDAWEKGRKTFSIEGIQKAGIPPLNLRKDTALEVMTGAVLPNGCDCVIPYEDVEISDGKAQLGDAIKLERMQCVHEKASDKKCGTVLVQKGARLLAAQVAIAASIGKTEILVSKSPKIAVIGTGDEVVAIDKDVESYQIRQSNAHTIQAALKLSGYREVMRFHIRDDKEEIKEGLEKILMDFDVLVLSGGVSMGKFDYIPQVLANIGVKAIFHQVKQRPGKPFWFGTSSKGKPVFALPGNPVSTQVGVYRYVLPYLNAAALAEVPKEEFAVLQKDIDVKTDRAYFLPVEIESQEDGRLRAMPVFPNVSGDYAALAKTDGFIELPTDTFRFSNGTVAPLYRWKN